MILLVRSLDLSPQYLRSTLLFRHQFFFQKGTSSGAGLADPVHQCENFVRHSAGVITSGTQAVDSGLLHTRGRASNPSLLGAHPDQILGGIFNPVSTSSAYMAEALLQQQMQQIHQQERCGPFRAASAHFWVPPSIDPLQARTASGFASASELEVAPSYSITPFMGAGHGFGGGSQNLSQGNSQTTRGNDSSGSDMSVQSLLQPSFCSNPRPMQWLVPESVASSISLTQRSQLNLSLYQWQRTGDVVNSLSSSESILSASQHQLATSQQGPHASGAIGAGDFSYSSRPVRPTPLRPMPGSIGSGSSSSSTGIEATHQSEYLAPNVPNENVPYQQFIHQDLSAAPPAGSLDEVEGSQIAVGSLLNP
jgi:hypothetical protein